jgi:arsenite methyltransferase
MTTSQPPAIDAAPGVDADELARHIAEIHHEPVQDLHFHTGRGLAEAPGYPADLLARLPVRAVSSFAGVGYHLDLANLVAGERMLDLGCGSGMEVFAAAVAVGPQGSVTGVDITPEQLVKAERLRRDEHVTFRHARIEELPFDDASFDVVISNGVANLSADKSAVFAEAARVLRPGGRLALADIVTQRAIAGIAGASQRDRYLQDIAAAGLELRTIRTSPAYRFASDWAQRTGDTYGAHTIELLAVKPTEEISK